MSLKDLKLGLIIEALDRATAPLRHIGEGLEHLEHKTEKLHHTMHKLGLAEFIGGALFTGVAVEAGHQIFEITEKTAQLGVELLHAAQKAGTTVEQMSKLRYAAKQLGVDQDSLSQVFFRFQTHLANGIAGQKETIKALKLLGLSMKEVRQLAKDPYEAFMRLVDGFHNIPNPTVRAKLAMDLFSRSGYQLLPMLKAGREEIEKFGDELQSMGRVMSTQGAERSEEFHQKLNRLNTALGGLQIKIGLRLLEPMTRLVDKLGDLVIHLKPEVIDRFTHALDRLIAQLPILLQFFEQLVEWIGAVIPKLLSMTDKVGGLKTVLTALAVLVGVQLVVAFAQMAMGIAKAAVVVGEFIEFVAGMAALATGVTTLTDAMVLLDIAMDANPIGLIVLAIAALVAAVAGIVALIMNWGAVTKWVQGVWESFTSMYMKLPGVVRMLFPAIEAALFITKNWGKIVAWAAWLWQGLTKAFSAAGLALHKAWDGVVKWFADLWKSVGDVFAKAWKFIEDMMPPWLKVLLKLGSMALSVGIHGLMDLGSKLFSNVKPPDQWVLEGPPGYKEPKPQAPGHAPAPAQRPPLQHGEGGKKAEVTKARADVHLHLTTDGRVEVRKFSSDGGGDLSIHRGVLPA